MHSDSKPNLPCSFLSDAEAPKVFMPMTRPSLFVGQKLPQVQSFSLRKCVSSKIQPRRVRKGGAPGLNRTL